MANIDLNNRLNLLLNSMPPESDPPGLDNLLNRFRKMNAEEEGTSENEAVMDSGQGGLGEKQLHFPKCISVRSNGYGNVKPSNENNGTQKVYVKGEEEQAVELEVYNQGMLKTEMCNKLENALMEMTVSLLMALQSSGQSSATLVTRLRSVAWSCTASLALMATAATFATLSPRTRRRSS